MSECNKADKRVSIDLPSTLVHEGAPKGAPRSSRHGHRVVPRYCDRRASAQGCSADNLISNGSYEAGLGNWTVLSGAPRIAAYGQSDSQARPAGYLGDSYVLGGPGGNGAVAEIRQEVSLGPCQAGVAGGGKVMHYGGWLGGYGTREDMAQLAVSFKAGGSTVGGGCTLDGPTAAGRGGATAMVELGGAPCPIPATATSAVLVVRFTSESFGPESTASYDNAYLWIA